MTKARSLADFISDGSPLADGTISVSEVSGAAPLANPSFTGNVSVTGNVDGVDIATRDAVLTSTTTTANAALPKAGGAVTGAITTNSTFDGRDIATDGTKLDGIEVNATADQTKSDIEGLGIDVPATNLTGTIPAARLSTATTQAESDDSTKIATTAYVVDKITTLIGGAPSTLNDLNELAAAINDDANYNTTLTTALATKLPLAGGTLTGNVTFGDNNKAIFGAGSDLEIYHDGSHSIIEDAGTGAIKIKVGDFRVENASGNNLIKGVGDVATLHHAGAEKLATTSTGIQVTGSIANASGDLTVDVAGDIILDAAGGEVRFSDGSQQEFVIDMNDAATKTTLRTLVSDSDLVFEGNDGGVGFAALTLDMSNAGAATFNSGVTLTGTLNVDSSTTNGFLSAGSNILNFGTTSNDTLAFYANNTNHMKLKPDGEVIINETGGAEGDLRVESDSVSHMLFVDAGNNRVGIGKSDPARTLDIHGSVEISVNTASHETFLFTTQAANDAKLMMQNASATTAVQLSANGDTFFNGGNVGIGVTDGDVTNDGTSARTYVGIIGTANRGRLNIGSTASNGADSGVISFVNGANELGAINMETNSGSQTVGKMYITSSDLLTLNSAGGVVFNDNSADADFRVESDTEAHMLFVDASTNRIGVMYNSPAANGIHVRPSGEAQIFIGSANAGGATLILDGDANGDGSGGDYAYIKHDTSGNLTIENLAPSGTEIAVNDNGENIDFRVESNNNANMLFVDASADIVNMGNVFINGTNGPLKIGGSGYVTNPTTLVLGQYTSNRGYIQVPNDGDLEIWDGGTNILAKIGDGGTVFNENSGDRDFRVESNDKDHMLFVDAGNNRIGMGDSSPASALSIISDEAQLIIGGSTGGNARGLKISTATTGYQSNDTVIIDAHNAASGEIQLKTQSLQRLKINSAETTFNEDSYDTDFRIESDNQANMLKVDGGNDVVLVASGTARTDLNAQLQVGSAFGIKSFDINSNTVTDTGISVNQGSAGAACMVLASNHGNVGTATGACQYFLHFYFSGNNMPAIHHVAGSSNILTFGKSANNTLTVQMPPGGNAISFLMNS